MQPGPLYLLADGSRTGTAQRAPCRPPEHTAQTNLSPLPPRNGPAAHTSPRIKKNQHLMNMKVDSPLHHSPCLVLATLPVGVMVLSLLVHRKAEPGDAVVPKPDAPARPPQGIAPTVSQEDGRGKGPTSPQSLTWHSPPLLSCSQLEGHSRSPY